MRLLVCIPVLAFCAFLACKKAKGPPNVVNEPPKKFDSTVHMAASINGASWRTDSAYGYNVKYSGNDTGISNLLISATRYLDNNNFTTIKFNITRFEGPNTYPINPPINTATYYDANNVRHYATSGTIIVVSKTAYALTGTFSFTADTVSVANGEFDVALP
ncbi:MAG: hypothetical protein K0Q79_668 [Flavipsychrobacter sp.]|jgi:hypothetical protein|nr:hypothetical protein [Flavipsychrobacter sp.]